MKTKKEFVLSVLNGEKEDGIPVGFWHHFTDYKDCNNAIKNPDILKKNIEGHRKTKEIYSPDFVKIMTDGLFFLPFDYASIHSVDDLKKLEPLKEDNPWFEKNIELASAVRDIYGNDILIFYNAFGPMTQMRDGIRLAQGLGFDYDPVSEF
jgi:hypothetical protein